MIQERTILHCDMNCFYASCEMAYHRNCRGNRLLYAETRRGEAVSF